MTTLAPPPTPARPEPPDGADARPAVDHRLEFLGLAVGAAIVVVTAIARIDATALWVDEAYSLGAANHLGESLRRTSGTMGLYYALLSVWAEASTATWWLRLPSVGFAIATLALLRPIARRIGGSSLVALALPMTALGPLFAWKAIEARAYALETLVTVACWYLVVRAIDSTDRRTRTRSIVLLVPLGVAGVFCHGLFIVQVVALVAVVLLGTRAWRTATAVGAAFVPAALAIVALRSTGAGDIGTNVEGGVGVLVASTFDALLARQPLAKLLLAQLVVIGLALAVRAAWRSAPSAERAVQAIPAAWTLLPCLTLGLLRLYDPVYNPRYLAPVAPGVALLLATMVRRLDDGVAQRWPALRPRRAVGPVAAVVVAAMALVLVTTPVYVRDDWRGAAQIVADRAQPGDGIVFANLSARQAVQHRPPFEAAWGEEERPQTLVAVSPPRPLAEVRRFDEPLALDAIAPAALDRGLRRLWVVEAAHERTGQAEVIIADPAMAAAFEETDRWHLQPDLLVVLLDRRVGT